MQHINGQPTLQSPCIGELQQGAVAQTLPDEHPSGKGHLVVRTRCRPDLVREGGEGDPRSHARKLVGGGRLVDPLDEGGNGEVPGLLWLLGDEVVEDVYGVAGGEEGGGRLLTGSILTCRRGDGRLLATDLTAIGRSVYNDHT